MSDIKCSIVKDLLPLYIDDVTCEDTKEFIKNHVANCGDCARELELLKRDITAMNTTKQDVERGKPIMKIKMQIRKRQIAIAVITALVVACIGLLGTKLYLTHTRPDLNGNEKFISTELTSNGRPENILFDSGNGFSISKEAEKIYLSLPVNNKKMQECSVKITYNGTEIENTKVSISDARYATYCFDNLQEKEEGLYLFAFYDMKEEINQYVSIILSP